MRTFLLVIHILAASAWFGHKLTIPRDIRTSLEHGPAAAAQMVRRTSATARLGIGSALLTVVSGVALLGQADWRATTLRGLGILAAIGAIVMGATLARPAWAALEQAVERGELAVAAAYGRRFARHLHTENLLWLAALTAMVAG
jgi:hypothetical protein